MGWADSVSAKMPYLGTALSDDASTGLSDTGTAIERDLAIGTDAFAASDDCSSKFAYLPSCSDDVGVTDVVGGKFAYLASFSDDFSAVLADLVVHSLLEAGAAVPLSYSDLGESVSLSDDLSARFAFLASASELLTYDDILAAVQRYLASTAADAVSLSEALASIERMLGTGSEDLGVSDDIDGFFRYYANTSDAVDIADRVARILNTPGVATTEHILPGRQIRTGKLGHRSIRRQRR